MAKKRSLNGFHLFANSRRVIYESQVGRRLSHKMLLELASVEWKNLTKEEQTAWLTRSKTPPQSSPMTQKKALTPRMPTMLMNASVTTMKKAHVVEQELFKRTYKCGLDRQTAREEFYGNLLWREKDHLEELINRRWGIVVLSPNGTEMANEIVCLCVENSRIVSEMRIYRQEAQVTEMDRLHPHDFLWDIDKPEDVNTACIRMNRFIHGCSYNYILVAAHQQAELSSILHLMKQTRDRLHDRETQSIRLDRLICIEDAVAMLRKLKNLPMVNMEQDLKWEQLTGEWEQMSTIQLARAISKYFLNCLTPETAIDFDENENLLIEEKIQNIENQQQSRQAAKWTLEKPTDFPSPLRFGISTSMPLLTPPEHISPRFRRHPLPRRWRLMQPSSSAAPPDHHRNETWNRPNPFAYPPQMAQDEKERIFQSVSRWLETISLDPPTVDEEEKNEEDCEQVH